LEQCILDRNPLCKLGDEDGRVVILLENTKGQFTLNKKACYLKWSFDISQQRSQNLKFRFAFSLLPFSIDWDECVGTKEFLKSVWRISQGRLYSVFIRRKILHDAE